MIGNILLALLALAASILIHFTCDKKNPNQSNHEGRDE